MNIKAISIDLAKNVFQLHGIDEASGEILKKRLTRKKLPIFVAKLPPCTIYMEACSGAYYWARKFIEFGHDAKLISPQFVKPFVKSHKNDANDAEGILIAGRQPETRFVPIKSVEKISIQSMHRMRESYKSQRNALVNQLRNCLVEFGIVIPQSIYHVKRAVPELLEDPSDKLAPTDKLLLSDTYEEMKRMDEKVKQYDRHIKAVFVANAVCKKLGKIEGVGPICATALYAEIAEPEAFANGRQCSAYVGLTPRQCGSGDKLKLLGISKKGKPYLRAQVIQGAKSVVYSAKRKSDRRSRWINAIAARRGENIAAVAVANKNVRIAWALMANKTEYDTEYRKAA